MYDIRRECELTVPEGALLVAAAEPAAGTLALPAVGGDPRRPRGVDDEADVRKPVDLLVFPIDDQVSPPIEDVDVSRLRSVGVAVTDPYRLPCVAGLGLELLGPGLPSGHGSGEAIVAPLIVELERQVFRRAGPADLLDNPAREFAAIGNLPLDGAGLAAGRTV